MGPPIEVDAEPEPSHRQEEKDQPFWSGVSVTAPTMIIFPYPKMAITWAILTL